MRLWSLHPRYLDRAGLTALWREALLAQKVLQGETKGYKNHPQMERFKSQQDPLSAIGAYLCYVYREGKARGYNYDFTKILKVNILPTIPVADSQVTYEVNHLLQKLSQRDTEKFRQLTSETFIHVNPVFQKVFGAVESWEKVKF